MDKPKINIELVNSRISGIREALQYLEELRNLSKDEFLNNYKNYNTAENLLRRILEGIFDIGRHILAKINGLSVDFEYKIIAEKMIKKHIVNYSMEDTILNIAGYRNRLIHFYHDIHSIEIYDILQKHLQDIEAIIKDISEFIKK